jgi:uncharacterized protein (DUF2336 family)
MMAGSEAARVRQSASATTAADTLKVLAHDPSLTVRAALAMNPAASCQVNAILACDPDERVRSLLGRKIAALTPSLTDTAHNRLQQETMEVLIALVADEAERVRASIAETLKDMADAPRAIILQLARDPAVMVCEPVIRFSPVLTSEDLIALIVAAPSPGTVLAAARRSRIDATVSDAIVDAANSEAIGALLANPSAQIREITLDALVARATHEPGWHEPLVRRPALPTRTARVLSEIVANHLLEVLLARGDLDLALAEELRGRLPPSTEAKAEASASSEASAPLMLAKASAMRDAGQLNDDSVLEAVQQGDVNLVIAMLAVKAGVALTVIEQASALRSAKGLVSLSWKAGLSMQVAVALQTLVARLQPSAVLQPRAGGEFPLSTQEMRWQIDFMCRVAT